MKYVRFSLFIMLALLSACKVAPVAEPVASGDLEFDVCPAAHSLPDARRAFQGLDGWFFFNHDFRETYEIMAPGQSDFVVQLSRAFATQGVLLVVVPVPGRGAIRPAALYLDDPKQAAYSPTVARANYDAYISTLEQNGVAAVDVMAVATAFDASGGQTFFKRDLHWTPEGSNAVAQVTAERIRRTIDKPLAKAQLTLSRNPYDKTHPGRFINNWLYSTCRITLPPEPLGDYTVSRSPADVQTAEVVQAGSSFGGSPFDQGFLGVALQSEVANVSVGNGGVFFALESYLQTRSYRKERPRVLVWEYPVGAQALSRAAQRRLLAGTYGTCGGNDVNFEWLGTAKSRVIYPDNPVDAAEHYLTLSFSDLSLLHFSVTLGYGGGLEEVLEFNRPEQTAEQNQGRFFTTLLDTSVELESVALEVPTAAKGQVTVQVCRNP